MNLNLLGWQRAVKGLREGDQTLLLTGLGLLALQYLRSSRPRKQLLYRKKLPIGSTIVVRHTPRGTPKLEIFEPE